MFWNTLRNENTKLLKRSLLWIELALFAGLVLLAQLVFYLVLQNNLGGEAALPDAQAQLRHMVTWPGALLNVLGFASGNAIGGLLLIILTGAVTAQEYSWRTLHLWLSRGVPRPVLLGARFAGLLLPALLITLTPLLVGGLLSAFFTLQLDGALPLDQVSFIQLGLSLLRTAYTLLPYAALAFLLAVATRSVVVAVGGGLAFALLVEGILIQVLALLGGSLAQIGRYLPAGLSNGLLSLNRAVVVTLEVNGRQAQLSSLEPLPAAIGIALWTLLFVTLAFSIFRRQDLTG